MTTGISRRAVAVAGAAGALAAVAPPGRADAAIVSTSLPVLGVTDDWNAVLARTPQVQLTPGATYTLTAPVALPDRCVIVGNGATVTVANDQTSALSIAGRSSVTISGVPSSDARPARSTQHRSSRTSAYGSAAAPASGSWTATSRTGAAPAWRITGSTADDYFGYRLKVSGNAFHRCYFGVSMADLSEYSQLTANSFTFVPTRHLELVLELDHQRQRRRRSATAPTTRSPRPARTGSHQRQLGARQPDRQHRQPLQRRRARAVEHRVVLSDSAGRPQSRPPASSSTVSCRRPSPATPSGTATSAPRTCWAPAGCCPAAPCPISPSVAPAPSRCTWWARRPTAATCPCCRATSRIFCRSERHPTGGRRQCSHPANSVFFSYSPPCWPARGSRFRRRRTRPTRHPRSRRASGNGRAAPASTR